MELDAQISSVFSFWTNLLRLVDGDRETLAKDDDYDGISERKERKFLSFSSADFDHDDE